MKSGDDNPVLAEINRALGKIDPLYGRREGLNAFLAALRAYLRQFNQSQLCRSVGLNPNSIRDVFLRRTNPTFLTIVRLCAVAGLRFRLERDPVPRRLAYGSHHPSYKLKVDDDGAWDLGDAVDD